jgi:hypothetical protein
VHILPPLAAAANFNPSALEEIVCQFRGIGQGICRIQVETKLLRVYMPPAEFTTANFDPSALDVIEFQFAVVGNPEVCLVQFSP